MPENSPEQCCGAVERESLLPQGIDGTQNAFGRVAIAQGFATAKQVEEAVEAMRKLAELGFRERLGEIMVKKGYLTTDQVQKILHIQGSRAANRIQGYEIVTKLGQGGMGAVYKARQRSLDRMVALKILAPHLAKDAAYVERFLREARAVAKLNHPNIIQGIDVGEADGHYYFAMEFVDGPTVADVMRKSGPLSEARALKITDEIAQALEHAHRHGLVHRDVKPDNIMLTRNNEAKLCDLGLAKSSASGDPVAMNEGRVVMGTPHYISPEQAKGEHNVDTRADIYSLGATLFHMVTGRTPFVGSSPAVIMTKHLTDPVDDPRDYAQGVSEGLVLLIGKMMAKEPGDRYPDPTALLGDVRAVAQGQIPRGASEGELAVVLPARKAAPPDVKRHRMRPVTRRLRRPQTAGSLLALGVLVVVVGGGFAFWPGGKAGDPVDRGRRLPEGPFLRVDTGAVPPGPENARETDANLLLERAIAFAGKEENATKFDDVIRRFNTVQTVGGNTESGRLAEAEIARWKQKEAAWKADHVERARAAVQTHLKEGQYERALAVWTSLPTEVLPSPKDARAAFLKREHDAIVEHGTKRFQGLVDEATALANRGRAGEARQTLTEASQIDLEAVMSKIPVAMEELDDVIKRQQDAGQTTAEQEWVAARDSIRESARKGEFVKALDVAKAAVGNRAFNRWRPEAERLADDMARMAMRQELALEGLASYVGSSKPATIHKGRRRYSAHIQEVKDGSVKIRPAAATEEVVTVRAEELSADDIRRHAPITLSDPAGNYDYAILLLYLGDAQQAKAYFERCQSGAAVGPAAQLHLEGMSSR
jgi:tRNA A-37 threonylcarbamoyl transferase component Bud32/tetratricopeptide (TPR) repeat protein